MIVSKHDREELGISTAPDEQKQEDPEFKPDQHAPLSKPPGSLEFTEEEIAKFADFNGQGIMAYCEPKDFKVPDVDFVKDTGQCYI